jgi:mono/diheme cytochrome c family protein
MPGFAWKLSDQEISDVVTFLRNGWGNQAPGMSPAAVADMRQKLNPRTSRLTANSGDHGP